MNAPKILRFCLTGFFGVSIGFCLIGLHVSRQSAEQQKEMNSAFAGNISKFKDAYASLDFDHRTILANKTADYVVAESKSIADSNASASLEIYSAIMGAVSFNVLGLICVFGFRKQEGK